jgi:nucleotidyltransferase/DNA polymerase involved in DNA repair
MASTYGAGHFVAEKAGMQAISADEKKRIAKIIEEASKGSKYYERAKQQDAALESRVKALRDEVARTPAAVLESYERQMRSFAAKLEASRDLSQIWVVVDMDAFYAACEELSDPSLKGTAFAVGSIGMISTASYEARKYGVRSAMAGFIALKLCPGLRFVKHDFKKYEAASEKSRQVFARYDSNFSTMSLDEATLSITAKCLEEGILGGDDAAAKGRREEKKEGGNSRHNSEDEHDAYSVDDEVQQVHQSSSSSSSSSAPPSAPASAPSSASRPKKRKAGSLPAMGPPNSQQQARIAALVDGMRKEVTKATGGLTCSAGIAPNSMLAKIVSNERKPDGQMLLPFDRDSIVSYMRSLPCRKIPGVGKVSEGMLKGLGLNTCGDLLDQCGVVRAAFNERMAKWLIACALGIGGSDDDAGDGEDDDPHGIGRKSLSQERTFADCGEPKVLQNICRELSNQVSEQMKEEKILGTTVTVKMKLHTFEIKQKQTQVKRPTNDADVIYKEALALLNSCMPMSLRLLGVKMSGFSRVPGTGPATLLDKFLASSSSSSSSSSPSSSSSAAVVGGASNGPSVGDKRSHQQAMGGAPKAAGSNNNGGSKTSQQRKQQLDHYFAGGKKVSAAAASGSGNITAAVAGGGGAGKVAVEPDEKGSDEDSSDEDSELDTASALIILDDTEDEDENDEDDDCRIVDGAAASSSSSSSSAAAASLDSASRGAAIARRSASSSSSGKKKDRGPLKDIMAIELEAGTLFNDQGREGAATSAVADAGGGEDDGDIVEVMEDDDEEEEKPIKPAKGSAGGKGVPAAARAPTISSFFGPASSSSSSSSSSGSSLVDCPVCGVKLPNDSAKINKHIDEHYNNSSNNGSAKGGNSGAGGGGSKMKAK